MRPSGCQEPGTSYDELDATPARGRSGYQRIRDNRRCRSGAGTDSQASGGRFGSVWALSRQEGASDNQLSSTCEVARAC